MYIQYGGYQHKPGEANLINFSVRPTLSPRGFKVTNIATAHVSGDICLTGSQDEKDTTTLVSDLIDALSVDGQDFGLYHDDGTPSPHIMLSDASDSLTGNQIVYYDFPASHNGEFATGRSFQYTVRNEFVSAERLILDYQESIEHVGLGGPIIEWRDNRYYGPTIEQLAPSSAQYIRQTGHSIGLDNYITPPPPIINFPFEIVHQRRIRRTGPRRYPQGFMGYRTDWSYTFRYPGIYAAFPTVL